MDWVDHKARDLLLGLYRAALASVEGQQAVIAWLRMNPLTKGPWHVIAVGKAAPAMAQGALEVLGEQFASGLIVTKIGYEGSATKADPRLSVWSAEHPWPGEGSLRAGGAMQDFIDSLPLNARCLFLFSGGASSLVEVPVEGVDLDFLLRVNRWLLASGLPIDQINRVRQRLSKIKGGGLRQQLGTREAIALLISDVPDDDPSAIGSGLLADELPGLPENLPGWISEKLKDTSGRKSQTHSIPHHVVASLSQAIDAAVNAARDAGYHMARMPEFLSGDAAVAGRLVAEKLCASPHDNLLIWGGETTVTLPEHPGRGGRNQHLALSAAMTLAGRRGCWLLSAGTDGSDGPTGDAGALVDGGTVDRGLANGQDPGSALNRADSGRFLESSGDLIHTGPTGTNVMDLVIALHVGSKTDTSRFFG